MTNLMENVSSDTEDFKVNILIGTPAYNGLMHLDYVNNLLEYKHRGIPFTLMGLGNESLITRARNSIISFFHHNKMFTHLMFIDADTVVPPDGIVALLGSRKHVIGAPVPLKGYDANGNLIYNVGEVLNPDRGENDLLEVQHVGTAALMFRRDAVTALVEDAIKDGRTYDPSKITRGQRMTETQYDVFQTKVMGDTYLSEDYFVCHRVRQLGFTVYVHPGVRTVHNGMFAF